MNPTPEKPNLLYGKGPVPEIGMTVHSRSGAINEMKSQIQIALEIEALCVRLDEAIDECKTAYAYADNHYLQTINLGQSSFNNTDKSTRDAFSRIGCSAPYNESEAQRALEGGSETRSLESPPATETVNDLMSQLLAEVQHITTLQGNLRRSEQSLGETANWAGPTLVISGLASVICLAMTNPLTMFGVIGMVIAGAAWGSQASTVTNLRNELSLKIAETEVLARSLNLRAQQALQATRNEATRVREAAVADAKRMCDKVCAHLHKQAQHRLGELEYQRKAFAKGVVCGKWDDPEWAAWTASEQVPDSVRLGVVSPPTPRLYHHIPNASPIEIPFLAAYESGRGLLVTASGGASMRGLAHSLVLRLLATVPPAVVRFTFIDPVSLGRNVAGFMALDRYEPSLIGGKAWSDAQHIDRALTEVTEHMETVIQKYLREDFRSIKEYNEKARVKEAYRVLLIFDFPVNFSDASAKRLASIMRNGPRCGVFPVVIVDPTKPLPYGFSISDLEQFATVLELSRNQAHHQNQDNSPSWFDVSDEAVGVAGCRVSFDPAPPKELVDRIVQAIGGRAREAMKVEVAFPDLLLEGGLSEATWWKSSGKDLVTVPLGPKGAHDVQKLVIGTGLAHHGLIVGRPGSGKTNLMHVIITSLALAYSPDELELYLVDFKKGVGFKTYADHSLPHARVIAIESEREFGISVLRGLDAELSRRGELFRKAKGAEKLSEYRDRTGDPMTRIVLVADEFQEFFTIEDGLSREASLLFDRIVRQGRAFGIHVILGTQTLAGAYGMARSTLDQISIRIALQCSDADSRLVLGDDNPGARFLSRAGEAIYNAEAGTVQANQLFQVALFGEDDKERYLRRVQEMGASCSQNRKPIVFEGHEPAHLEHCESVRELLQPAESPKPKNPSAWLGEPIAIKEPTSARLRRQSGANLLVVTREEEHGVGVIASALCTLALQASDDAARFIVMDYSLTDAEWTGFCDAFADAVPHEVKVVRRRQVADVIAEAINELEARAALSAPPRSSLYLVVLGLQRARELRKDEDDYSNDSPQDLLLRLLREGPEVGIHALVWSDTPASLSRTLGRKALSEFGLRAAGVMSIEESQLLLEDSSAARIDRPHRMLFYDEERPGALERFRPFSVPRRDWLSAIGQHLQETV